MKKHQFILITLIILGYQTHAQNYKWSVGIEGGPGLRTLKYKPIKNTPYSSYPYALNYILGGFTEYNLKGKFSLKADLLIEKKGMTTKWTDIGGPLPNTNFGKEKTLLNIYYLTIPVLAKLSFGHKVKFFINAGPYIGFLLGQYYKDKRHSSLQGTHYTTSYTTDYKNFDIGITSGIGLTIPIGKRVFINTEIRNNFGLYYINKTQLNNPNSDPPTRNITFNLVTGIGYRF